MRTTSAASTTARRTSPAATSSKGQPEDQRPQHLCRGSGEVLKDVAGTCNGSGWVGIKEPEDEDDGSGITRAQIDYIDQYLEQTDATIFGADFEDPDTGWRRYLDEASTIDFVIAMELTKNYGANMRSSVFMYKQRDPDLATPGELNFGPIWDFDTSMGNIDFNFPGGLASAEGWWISEPNPEITADQSDYTWFHRLHEDDQFVSRLEARWAEVHTGLRASDGFIVQQQGIIATSAAANVQRWPEMAGWSTDVSFVRSWLDDRFAWLDDQYDYTGP